MQGERLLSIDEVAARLSVHRDTVRNMVKRKTLPPGRKIHGKLIRWFESDINNYLHRLRNDPPADPEASDEDEE